MLPFTHEHTSSWPPGPIFPTAVSHLLGGTMPVTVARGARPLCAFAAFALLGAPLAAQNAATHSEATTKESWMTPPAEVSSVVLAPRYLNVSLNNPSPNRKQFLRTVVEDMPTQAKFAKQHYYLGGLQIDFAANRSRALTTRGASRIELISPEDGKVVTITPPTGGTIAGPQWSPDGSHVAYLVNFDNGSQLYVADAATGKGRALTKTPLLATHVTAPEWGGAKRIFVVVPPDARGAPPVEPATPTTPKVRVTDPAKNPRSEEHTSEL